MLEKYLCIGLPKRDAKPFIRHLMLLFLQHKFESPILNVALALNSFLFGVNTPLQFMSNSYFYPVLSVNRLMGLWVLLKDTLWRTLCSWMWYDAYCYLCVTHRYINYYQLLVMILDLKFLYSKLLPSDVFGIISFRALWLAKTLNVPALFICITAFLYLSWLWQT